MAVTVKRITLWRAEVEHTPGTLAHVLAPLSRAGADLRLVMGYGFPHGGRAAIEVHPVSGKKATAAAREAGMAASEIACVLVEGDNRPGLGARLAEQVAAGGINISFLVAQVIGRRFVAVFGFADDDTAVIAMRTIRSAARMSGTKPSRGRARRRR